MTDTHTPNPADAAPTAAPRIRFPGLEAAAFQHALDRQAIRHLKRIKGFDFLIAKFLEYGIERAAYVHNIGSSVRVGPRQMPRLHAMLVECCAILDLPEPELYVQQGRVSAYTSGHTQPYIILQTSLLELLDDDEAMVVIAHELGHIKCNHVLYKAMARSITPLLLFLPPAARLVIGQGVQASLRTWDRRSEFSADRASLLVMQDARPCMNALLKLAGGTGRWVDELNLEVFLEQASAHRENGESTLSDRFYHLLVGSVSTHPFTVERAKALQEWSDDPQYQRILAGDYAVPSVAEETDPVEAEDEAGDSLSVTSGIVPPAEQVSGKEKIWGNLKNWKNTIAPPRPDRNLMPPQTQTAQSEIGPSQSEPSATTGNAWEGHWQVLIYRNGEQFGPYAWPDVQAYLLSGHLVPGDLAWCAGLPEWVPLAQLLVPRP